MFKVMGQEQFDAALVVTPMADGRRWKIHEAFHYETDGGARIEVPAGTITDFASIPRLLWPILPPTGRYTRAAVVHDVLYSNHRTGLFHYSRAYADAILMEAMRDCGCGWLCCYTIWIGVRIGGWAAWSAKEKP
jgi:hypothetical protein